jgi:hypothetical protein
MICAPKLASWLIASVITDAPNFPHQRGKTTPNPNVKFSGTA